MTFNTHRGNMSVSNHDNSFQIRIFSLWSIGKNISLSSKSKQSFQIYKTKEKIFLIYIQGINVLNLYENGHVECHILCCNAIHFFSAGWILAYEVINDTCQNHQYVFDSFQWSNYAKTLIFGFPWQLLIMWDLKNLLLILSFLNGLFFW